MRFVLNILLGLLVWAYACSIIVAGLLIGTWLAFGAPRYECLQYGGCSPGDCNLKWLPCKPGQEKQMPRGFVREAKGNTK